MKKILFLLSLLSSSVGLAQQTDVKPTLRYYLPSSSYSTDITEPADFLGFEPGEWHATPELALAYYRLLDSQSDRIMAVPFGKTWEHRPLVAFIISTPENLSKIESIRERHLNFSNPKKASEVNASQEPVVIWQGFSVHGNEPSGANAALLYVYHLAASTDPSVQKQLETAVIIIDPVINPDGGARFANWANSRRATTLANADPNDTEHNEPWPRGRTNHYWFDLNRDWLPVVNPESKGRLALFKAWMPNVLTDHHEMGTNSTFFFQPGVPARTNPLTPKQTVELTGKIGNFHAAALDSIGSYYFTKESYDDFYYGKGSTYPDLQGGVGILFEQASSRGHRQESVNGVLSFAFTVKNQLTTALSTLKAATEMRKTLLEHQTWFFKSALEEAAKDPVQGYVIGDSNDPEKSRQITDLLLRHSIEVYQPSKDHSASGVAFTKSTSIIIPSNQTQFRLVKALFSRATKFEDSLFYDISTWTLPFATNTPFAELNKPTLASIQGSKIEQLAPVTSSFQSHPNPTGFYIPAGQVHLHRFLSDALEKGFTVKVIEESSTAATMAGVKRFVAGSLFVPVHNQPLSASGVSDFLKAFTATFHLEVHSVATGLASEGIDAGSPSALKVSAPEIALLVGEGTVSNDTGELWHLLDAVQGMPVTLLPVENVTSRALNRYNRVIMPNGMYGTLTKTQTQVLKDSVRNGGLLIGVKNAISWLISNDLLKAEFTNLEVKPDQCVSYNQQEAFSGSQEVAGAIFEAQIDPSHPIGWGYLDGKVSLFRDHNRVLKPSENKASNPVMYKSGPQQSGWVSSAILKKIQGTAEVSVQRSGNGRIIVFADNPNFRSFFTGTNRMFLNAVFYGDLIRSAATDTAE